MNFVRLLPVMLSMLLLGAHFLRYENFILLLACCVILLILLIRRPWVARLTQIVLVIGGIEWVRTLIGFAKIRQAAGDPWIRLAIILGGVTLLTISSALVFRFKALRERYCL